jgi:ADP-ribose pyrophosphatase YjhB (NUDIX family)
MRIYEKSSGGIVYRKTDSTIEILLLERKNSKNEIDYVLPKGHMEADETAKQTALREINEETGLEIADLEIIQFLCKTNYSFVASHQE